MAFLLGRVHQARPIDLKHWLLRSLNLAYLSTLVHVPIAEFDAALLLVEFVLGRLLGLRGILALLTSRARSMRL